MRMRAIGWALLAAGSTVWAFAGCDSAATRSPSAAPAHGTEAWAKSPRSQEEAASRRSPFLGKPAPDFALKDQAGRTVALDDLRGKWVVLYFYPKDDTPGCTCEATEFTHLLAQFRDMGAEVYGVSEDPPEVHRIFIKQYNLGVDLFSDPDHQVMRRYGAWVDTSLGDSRYERMIRSTVLIGPDGTIRYHWPEVIPTGHAERVRQKLAELQEAPA